MSRRVVSSGDEEDLGEDASKQERRTNAIDADEDITLVNVQDDADKEMFDVDILNGDEMFAEQEVAAKDVNLTVDEVTLAQALAALKSVKSKVKGDVIKELSIPVSAANAPTKVSAASALIKDKDKGIMVEEPMKTMKKKDLIKLNKETAKRLQAEFDEEERHAREKDEANIALTEEWDDIQAKIKADHELAQRLQAEGQEEFFQEGGIHLLNLKLDFGGRCLKRELRRIRKESTKKQKVDEDKDTSGASKSNGSHSR
ncbi:hypothetical protein Tco_0497675 [Tanacetum coccineum]